MIFVSSNFELEDHMTKIVLCSNCFNDNGLRLDAFKIGIEKAIACPNCHAENGKKLNRELIEELAHRFFVRGTIQALVLLCNLIQLITKRLTLKYLMR